MKLVSEANIELLILARNIAHKIGKEKGFCSIEDIRRNWTHPAPFGQWAESIFKEEGFWTYEKHVKSSHAKANGRMVALWRYTDKPAEKQPSKPLINLAKKVEFGQKNLFDVNGKPRYRNPWG